MRHKAALYATSLTVTLLAQIASAETITGRVVGVSDGDTIIILEPGKRKASKPPSMK